MATISRRRFFLLASLAPCLESRAQLIGNGGGGWSVRGTDPVEIFHGDRRVTAHHAGYETGLPLFDPVVGPTGGVFTAPPKEGPGGAWFALGNVNGYDFHGPGGAPTEGRKAGRILHKGMNGVLVKGPAIVIRTKSEWFDAADETRRICSDRREFTFYHREDGSLAVEIALELMADAGDLEIGVESEGAWHVRVVPGLVWKEGVEGLEQGNSEGLAGTAVSGARAKWLFCQGKEAKGEAAGVAILDHPGNPGHPAAWTVRGDGIIAANPFTDPAALPRIVPNGESIHFRYRTIFFRGSAEGVDLEKAYEAFAAR